MDIYSRLSKTFAQDLNKGIMIIDTDSVIVQIGKVISIVTFRDCCLEFHVLGNKSFNPNEVEDMTAVIAVTSKVLKRLSELLFT